MAGSLSDKVNVEGTLLFEQPFIRNYRRVFRTHQKHIERELSAVQNAARDIGSRVKSGSLTKEEASKALEGMMGRVTTLKRKLADLHSRNGKPTLDTVDSVHDPEHTRWLDTRIDRWLVDWSLRVGRDRTARKLAKQKSIEDIHRIETALESHSCTEALAWCSDNKSALKKAKNSLEFDLRLQEYVELCRLRQSTEAMAYFQKHLSLWKGTHERQLLSAAALIAFDDSTRIGTYRRLYDTNRWRTHVQCFRNSIYSLNSLPSEPLLHLALYAGLAALKLPVCFSDETKNVDCPVCDGEAGSGHQGLGLGILAREVPLCQHQHSTIAMEAMAAQNDGRVTCPRTNQACHLSELRKVFIS
ncbi:CTLH/CRA C-terminal to lish motif domain-containing protein [Flagelloscypha sp. PMI_526]|nr:CTLH/CRA C-terminal to lish motif domain-containing protein [Flagelloscypha sp. PMI_526]